MDFGLVLRRPIETAALTGKVGTGIRGEQKLKKCRKGAHAEVKPKNRAGKSLVGKKVGAKLGPKLGPIGPVFES